MTVERREPPPVATAQSEKASLSDQKSDTPKASPAEIGGRAGPEPTRYGDWEKHGIVSDF